MRIACVDKNAGARLQLHARLVEAFEQCRASVGHISLASLVPCSREELLLQAPPHAVIVGTEYELSEAISVCRELKNAFPTTPIIALLSKETYSVRSLQRLESVSVEAFCIDDIRLIHRLYRIEHQPKDSRLVTFVGAKGGVGATSLITGTAHALHALGKAVLCVDLSPYSVIARSLSAAKWHSTEYASALHDHQLPDISLARRCVITSPSGIDLYLPPAGGPALREHWLRDRDRFELSLTMLDLLRDSYDIVLVDLAGSEGVLPFALMARSDARILVSSLDPACVYLLQERLTELADLPGGGETRILINAIGGRLQREDVIDFLYSAECWQDGLLIPGEIPRDERAGAWAGTGNSFYTEGSRALQRALERSSAHLCGISEPESPRREWSLLGKFRPSPKRLEAPIRMLPEPKPEEAFTFDAPLPVGMK